MENTKRLKPYPITAEKFWEYISDEKIFSVEEMNQVIITRINKFIDKAQKVDHEITNQEAKTVFIGGDASQKQISIGPWSITVIRSSVVMQSNRKTIIDCASNLHLFVPNSTDLTNSRTHISSIINQIGSLISLVDEESYFKFSERFIELYKQYNDDDGIDSCEPIRLDLSIHNLRPILETAACIQFIKNNQGELGDIYYFDGPMHGTEIDLFTKDESLDHSETKKYDWFLAQDKIFAGVIKSCSLINEAHYWREIIENKKECELLKLNDKVIQRLGNFLDDRERILLSNIDSSYPFEFYLLFSAGNVSAPCLIQVLKNKFFMENREKLYESLIQHDTYQNTPLLSIPAVVNAAHNASYFHESEIVFLQKILYNKLVERPESLLKLYKFDLAKNKLSKTRFVKKQNPKVGNPYAKKRAA